jgi:hypothetical protein
MLLWRDSIIESFLYIGICFIPSFLPPSEIKQEEIIYVIKKQGLKCFDKLLFPLVRTAAFLEYNLFFFENTDTKSIIDKYVELNFWLYHQMQQIGIIICPKCFSLPPSSGHSNAQKPAFTLSAYWNVPDSHCKPVWLTSMWYRCMQW